MDQPELAASSSFLQGDHLLPSSSSSKGFEAERQLLLACLHFHHLPWDMLYVLSKGVQTSSFEKAVFLPLNDAHL